MPPFAGNCVELLPEYDQIIERMAQEIEGARRFVHVEFYIIGRDTTTAGFFAAMERAVQRGVKVRLLLDQIGSRKYPGRKEMEQHLTAIGVDWHYMLPLGKPGEWLRFDLRNHRKILVVDGEAGYTGLINAAQRRLVIANPYFVPDDALMLAITSAALRGVRVSPRSGAPAITAPTRHQLAELLPARAATQGWCSS